MSRYSPDRLRRDYLLRRLREADGPGYDTLCAEVAGKFPEKTRCWTTVRAVRAVRALMWDQVATVDSDVGVWLLAAGWQAAA